MPELARAARTDSTERLLTDEDWVPTPSWIEERTPSEPAALRLVHLAPSATPTAWFDPLFSEPAWLATTVEKLAELLQLPPNWSSYRAATVRPELASALLALLLEVMGDDTPAPAIVPTASGGLQAEWHRKGYDLEIEVCSPSRFVAHFENVKTGKVESLSVVSDLRRLVEWIIAVSG